MRPRRTWNHCPHRHALPYEPTLGTLVVALDTDVADGPNRPLILEMVEHMPEFARRSMGVFAHPLKGTFGRREATTPPSGWLRRCPW